MWEETEMVILLIYKKTKLSPAPESGGRWGGQADMRLWGCTGMCKQLRGQEGTKNHLLKGFQAKRSKGGRTQDRRQTAELLAVLKQGWAAASYSFYHLMPTKKSPSVYHPYLQVWTPQNSSLNKSNNKVLIKVIIKSLEMSSIFSSYKTATFWVTCKEGLC